VQQHRRTDADGRSRNGGHHQLRRGRERFQVTDGGRHLPRLGGKVRQIIPPVKQSGAPAISRNTDGGIAIRVRQCLGQPVYTWRGRSSSPAGSGESRESGLDVNYNMIGHESSWIVREDETKQPQEFLTHTCTSPAWLPVTKGAFSKIRNHCTQNFKNPRYAGVSVWAV